jgi:hypothetical protein
MSLTPALAVEHPEVASLVPWLLMAGVAMIVGSVVASTCLTILVVRRSEANRKTLGALREVDFRGAGRRLLVAHRALRLLAVVVFLTWAVPYIFGQGGRAMAELVFVVIYGCLLAPCYITTRILGTAFQQVGTAVESQVPRENA